MANYETKRIFSANLTHLLREHGKTQLDLSKAMGVTPSTVSSWCTGDKMPRMDKVERLAEYFNVPRSVLIYNDEPTPVSPLSPTDQSLLDAYHRAPISVQSAIVTLLEPYKVKEQVG